MGGDTVIDEEEFSRSSSSCSSCFSDDVNIPQFSTDLRKRDKAYHEILHSYDESLRSSKRKLKLARLHILRYTPGSFSDVNLRDYDPVPKTTSIILVGPKGAGKSSLVNRITRVIENDEFAPPRAQESYGSTSSKGGTFFVQQYMIPRGSSASFCLYDTRGLSQISSSDNTSKIEQWITRGVCHGEPVIWDSDSSDIKERLIIEGGTGCEIRKVNSVIFVVNAVEMLKSMETETSYAHMISTAFNCPLLSFRDDKPALVMTHGDILSQEERARVRVFLGELLSIPPDKQIFDIPESRDAVTALTICDLLRYSLEHADKNLRFLPKMRERTVSKVTTMIFSAISVLLVILAVILHEEGQNVAHEAEHELPISRPPSELYNFKPEAHPEHRHGYRYPNDAHVPNHESESVPEGEPSIDWRTGRHLWFDERKVAEAEPSLDWRTTRRLWYVE